MYVRRRRPRPNTQFPSSPTGEKGEKHTPRKVSSVPIFESGSVGRREEEEEESGI